MKVNTLERTYWVCIDKKTGLAGSHRVKTPRLYLGRKAAIAAHRGWDETDEHVLKCYDIVEVRVVPHEG